MFERFSKKQPEERLTLSKLFPPGEEFNFRINDWPVYRSREIANGHRTDDTEVLKNALAVGFFVINILDQGGTVSYELNGNEGNISNIWEEKGESGHD